MSARALAAEIREGRVSARAAIEAALARIGAIDPLLNCFCLDLADEALEAAGAPLGPLHGVPVAIKDFTPSKGTARPAALTSSRTGWPIGTR